MSLEKRWAIDSEIELKQLTEKRLLSIIYGMIFGETIGGFSQTASNKNFCFGLPERKYAESVLDNLICNTELLIDNKSSSDGEEIIKIIAPVVGLFAENCGFLYIKTFLENILKKCKINNAEMPGIIIFTEIMFRLYHYDDYDHALNATALACKKHLADSGYSGILVKYNVVFDQKTDHASIIQASGDVYPYCLAASLLNCRNNNSFEESLFAVSNYSLHGDIIGAITGAMAGIYYKIDKMPVNWIDQLGRKDDINILLEKILKLQGRNLSFEKHE